MHWLPSLWLALLLSGAVNLKAQVAYINEYPTPTQNYALAITAGPDGALWFTEGSKIGRITTAGVITEYPIPTANSFPYGIATGPDGALWFAETEGKKIGRITTAGAITEYLIPTANSFPRGIAAGPDGALWFTELVGKIGRITTAGIITEYPTPTANSAPTVIAAGPDGALWFTEAGKIGRITTAGVITEYPVLGAANGIAAGPDGALWFTTGKIGRITTAGVITEYPIPTGNSIPFGIVAGPDGALWFTEYNADKIGRITTAGVITEYPIPTPAALPWGIAAGPDGALWFTESETSKIGQVVLSSSNGAKPLSHVSPLPPTESVANFPVHWSGTDTGSSIYGFTIYVSDSGGPFTAWLTVSTLTANATQATYSGILGHTYSFYSIASDWAGNQENPKNAAEATTYVASAPGDLTGDGAVNCADLAVVVASFGKTAGQPGYNPAADVNHDGVVNVRDLSWVAQYLPPGTHCQ